MCRAILFLFIVVSLAARAQTTDPTPSTNPARPTVSVPAVLPPTGYLQFEQGFNRAVTSPSGTTAQSALNQASKIALNSRILVEVLCAPFTYNTVFTSAAGATAAQLIPMWLHWISRPYSLLPITCSLSLPCPLQRSPSNSPLNMRSH